LKNAAPIIAFGAITSIALLAAPAIAVQLAVERALSPSQIGLFFMVELGGMSLASIPATWWMRRFSWHRIGFTAVAVFVLANLSSIGAQGFASLLVLRGCSALAGGALMILAMTAAARVPDKERMFGLWVTGQLVLGAIALAVLPFAFGAIGIAALFAALAVSMLAAAPLLRLYPPGLPDQAGTGGRGVLRGRALIVAMLALAAILLFYLGLGGFWTFIAVIAGRAGVSPQASGAILAVATLFGIAGSVCASVIAGRLARRSVLIGGYALMTASVAGLLGLPGVARFAVAACVFKFAWTFVLPAILAGISDAASDPRVINNANLMIGAGLAIGPVLSGNLIEHAGIDAMLAGSTLMVGLSAAALAVALRRPRAG